MEWFRETRSRAGRLRMNLWERIVLWIREKLGLDNQRPRPLKELKCRISE